MAIKAGLAVRIGVCSNSGWDLSDVFLLDVLPAVCVH